VFQLTLGLKFSWQKRRTTKRVRDDFSLVARLLQLNLGRGFYSYTLFKEAPGVRSDASKSDRYAGGGWVSQCGRYDFWKYGTNASKRMIDYLEGDVVGECARQMGHLWKGCKVPFGVDNSAFQQSASKGRSRADRLNEIIRELYYLMLKYGFICLFYWLSSEDNLLADLLSRPDGEQAFLREAYAEGFWTPGVVPQRMSPEGPAPLRVLPEVRGVLRPGDVEKAAVDRAEADVLPRFKQPQFQSVHASARAAARATALMVKVNMGSAFTSALRVEHIAKPVSQRQKCVSAECATNGV